jgi:fumarate reductase (CoM/CoB) subunit A
VSGPQISNYCCDVVIVGGGAAAALAAVAARKVGATVALITKESSLVGGATIMAAGGTSISISPGDSSDIFLGDMLKAGCNLNNPKLASMVAGMSKDSLLNLEKEEFLLDRKDANTLRTIKQGEGHAFPRGYLDRREAIGVCHALARTVMRHEITVLSEMVVYKVLLKEGQAAGVLALSLVTGEYMAVSAKAVILATGGLGALYEVTTNSAVLTGDGYAIAWDCGAELLDMEMVQFLPLAFPYPRTRKGKIIGMCSHFGLGVKLFNGLGERYMAKYDAERLEFTTRDVGARANYTEIREGRGNEHQAVIVDPTDHDPNIWLRWKTSLPHHYAMFKQVFGEEASEWKKPFEAMPSQHFFMGGIRIDEKCRTGITGLFAVGEVAGGVHGANRLSGTAFTEVFVFGPLAGESAGSFAVGRKALPPDASDTKRYVDELEGRLSKRELGVRPFELKEAIQQVMWNKLGPVRDEAGIRAAITSLEQIHRAARDDMVIGPGRKYNRERMEAVELPLMARTALLVATAALCRQESRGSHYRTDFPSRDDSLWQKNIALTKDEKGGMRIDFREANVTGEP